jgi:hypothetical protein
VVSKDLLEVTQRWIEREKAAAPEVLFLTRVLWSHSKFRKICSAGGRSDTGNGRNRPFKTFSSSSFGRCDLVNRDLFLTERG